MANAGGYDVNLLHAAPDASKAQTQAGYNVDLLSRNQTHEDSGRSISNHDPTLNPHQEKPESRPPFEASSKKPSFWRTKTGIFALVLLVVVIVGAIVGGTVGGVLSHKSKNTSSSSDQGMGGGGSGGSDMSQGTSPQTTSVKVGQGVATVTAT